jgi:xylan 1,4-beta-xylosidase
MRVAFLTIMTLLASLAPAQQQPPKTFCNPLDLNYGFFQRGERIVRHGADPVIVLYKDRYYLFSSWENGGYRVSDDLLTWTYIPFAPGILAERDYVAAAVAVIDGAIYFSELGSQKKPAVGIWRTTDPDSGKWENVRKEIPKYADPTLFVDPPTGRVFMYHGLDHPIRGVELDRKTLVEIPDTDTQLMPPFDLKTLDGWEICTWDNNPASEPMRSNKTFNPCREGSWMTYFNGTYYLQYASPGTTVPGYADGVLTSDKPLGPFTYQPYSPISHKLTGFVTSAGHSCLFQDRHGNWWRATTMLIGVNHRFERRLGLFPAGFDKDGVPYTRTDLGEAPITIGAGPRDHAGDVGTNWVVVSDGTTVTASTTLKDHAPALAADEDVRTWWSAETGDAGEWMQIDLGVVRDLVAAQVNLAEQDVRPIDDPADDVHRYTLSVSTDGTAWKPALDRSSATTAAPHGYVAFEKPVRARYARLENRHMPRGGKFAVSDLRLFAAPYGDPPSPPELLAVKRDNTDRREVTLRWSPAPGATGYLIRYGIDVNKLNLHHRIRGGDKGELTLYNLNHAPPYHFRIASVNDGGVTNGPAANAP